MNKKQNCDWPDDKSFLTVSFFSENELIERFAGAIGTTHKRNPAIGIPPRTCRERVGSSSGEPKTNGEKSNSRHENRRTMILLSYVIINVSNYVLHYCGFVLFRVPAWQLN